MQPAVKIDLRQPSTSFRIRPAATPIFLMALLLQLIACVYRSVPAMVEDGIKAVGGPARCLTDSDCSINSISFHCRRQLENRRKGEEFFYSYIESKRDGKGVVARDVESLLKENESFCEVFDDCDECMQCVQRIVFKSGLGQSYELPGSMTGKSPACEGGVCVPRLMDPEEILPSNKKAQNGFPDPSEHQFQLVAKMISMPDSAQRQLDGIVPKTPDMALRKIFWEARIASRKKNYAQALDAYHRITASKAFQPDPRRPGVELDVGSRRVASLSVSALYNSACVMALQKKTVGANRFLELTVQSIRNLIRDDRYVDIGLQMARKFLTQIEQDPDLSGIRGSVQFQATKAQLIDLVPGI